MRARETFRVECEDCSSSFVVARRTYRDHVARALPFRCRPCQIRAGVTVKLTAKERTRYRRFWLKRFTLRELDELCGYVFGPAAVTPERRERRELLASALVPEKQSRRAA